MQYNNAHVLSLHPPRGTVVESATWTVNPRTVPVSTAQEPRSARSKASLIFTLRALSLQVPPRMLDC